MKARLKNSIQWTSFPKEFEQQLHSVLKESFAAQASDGKFVVESRIYPNEILLRLGYLKSGQISQFNAEASIEYDANKENAKDIINLAVDCCASVLQNNFEDPETEFPHIWQMHQVEKKQVYLQVSRVNTDLESQADSLLNEESEDKLYKE
ncbi:hypothetical protein N9W41_01170 [bacterium]|nr:hypothetical protein [bacterium]